MILYQIETVPVPTVHQNRQANSYKHLQIERPYIALNSEKNIFQLDNKNLEHVKRLNTIYCKEPFMIKHKINTTVTVQFIVS